MHIPSRLKGMAPAISAIPKPAYVAGAAPPVYRPAPAVYRPVPPVQRAAIPGGAGAAPPVYRPVPPQSAAPPVYRPVPPVQRTAIPGRAGAAPPVYRPAAPLQRPAPPVYRPGTVQPMKTTAGSPGAVFAAVPARGTPPPASSMPSVGQPGIPDARSVRGQSHAGVLQRVRVQDSADGSWHETTEMSTQDVIALALRFYQLHNMSELRKIQLAHPRLAISDGDLYQLAYGDPHPRTTKRHPDSDGESDNEDPGVAHRSLRKDEASPQTLGLLPPVGHDPTVSASAHITAGSRAKKKSRFISGSRSRKKAGAWASTNTTSTEKGRVATYDLPYGYGDSASEPLDVTRPSVQHQLFPNGGSALNSAKASQEVLVPDRVPPEYIRSIHEVEKLSVGEYRKRKASGSGRTKLMRSRAKTKEAPIPIALHEIYNREAASEERLRAARAHWDAEIADVVEQTNAQVRGSDGFDGVDEDDVTEFLEDRTDNPYSLDYIQNDTELQTYILEMNAAVSAYIRWAADHYR